MPRPAGCRWRLSGSLAAVVLAYVVRFLAIPAGGLDAAIRASGERWDWSWRPRSAPRPGGCCGATTADAAAGARAAALLTFLDAMKELPATLLLRPLNHRDSGARAVRRGGGAAPMRTARWRRWPWWLVGLAPHRPAGRRPDAAVTPMACGGGARFVSTPMQRVLMIFRSREPLHPSPPGQRNMRDASATMATGRRRCIARAGRSCATPSPARRG